MDQNPAHIDPTDTAVAAILSLDLDAHGNDIRSIAAALQPLVDAAPALPPYSEDDQWTAAEEAIAAAMTIAHGVRNRDENTSDWWRLWDQVQRLRTMQRAHRASLVSDRIGDFPGFKVWVGCRWTETPIVRIFEAGVSVDLSPSLFDLPQEVTRREVEMAILGWKAGNDQGLRDGAESIRRGMRNLLEVEAA